MVLREERRSLLSVTSAQYECGEFIFRQAGKGGLLDRKPNLAQLDTLRKDLLQALAESSTHTQELRTLLEKLALPATSHDYSALLCHRMAETHRLKKYLNAQNQFFDLLKADVPAPAPEPHLPLKPDILPVPEIPPQPPKPDIPPEPQPDGSPTRQLSKLV